MQLKTGIYLVIVAAGLGAIAIAASSRPRQSANLGNNPKQPVIVELFTSEGCSSCPPADALLKHLSDEQPIDGADVIALEEHVDYWNQLGWTDPYSAREFSARQEDYAGTFHSGSVYTPQMVVDGSTEFVGSHGHDARAAIQRAASTPKARVTLTQTSEPGKTKATFDVRIESLPAASSGAGYELWFAVTEKGLQTAVNAGENSGETLQHADVVRVLRKVETLKEQSDKPTQITVELKRNWKLSNVRAVAFLVDKSSRHILGAATARPVA